jgi:hypothetical protein
MRSYAHALLAMPVALFGCITGTSNSSPSDPVDFFAGAHDDYVEIGAESASAGAALAVTGTPTSTPPHLQRMRAPVCPLAPNDALGTERPCPGDPVVPLPECGDTATLPPLWERTVPDEVASGWRLVGWSVCARPADVTPTMVGSAFRRLPLTPSPLVVQPGRGWVLVNKETVVHAEGGPQTLTTTILGIGVTITATPTSYAWDFGDGATMATADPGLPWPDGALAHTYKRVGGYRLGLTTTWSATYTLAGDPTVRDVPGTATTTGAVPLEVRERRAYLVGTTCADDPAAPGC